jgi:hypothetical protein
MISANPLARPLRRRRVLGEQQSDHNQTDQHSDGHDRVATRQRQDPVHCHRPTQNWVHATLLRQKQGPARGDGSEKDRPSLTRRQSGCGVAVSPSFGGYTDFAGL